MDVLLVRVGALLVVIVVGVAKESADTVADLADGRRSGRRRVARVAQLVVRGVVVVDVVVLR